LEKQEMSCPKGVFLFEIYGSLGSVLEDARFWGGVSAEVGWEGLIEEGSVQSVVV
jgi:hypothetical protein